MSLQEIFYIVAIVTMSIHILVLFIALGILIAIRKKIADTADALERRIENVKNFVTHPNVVATSLGKLLLDQATKKLSGIFRR